MRGIIARIFAPIDKAGHIARAGLTTTAMHMILAKRAKQAGVSNVSLHDFRRTVTGNLLYKGKDSAASQLVSVPYKAA